MTPDTYSRRYLSNNELRQVLYAESKSIQILYDAAYVVVMAFLLGIIIYG